MERAVNKERTLLFDNMRGQIMLLIVLTHFIDTQTNTHPVFMLLYILLQSFLNPAFIFVAGYFGKNTEKESALVLSKLIVPYLVINLALLAGYALTGTLEGKSLLTPNLTTWFLLTLAYYRLIAPAVKNVRFLVPLLIISGLLIGFDKNSGEFLSVSRTIAFAWIYFLGLYTKEEHINKIRNAKWGLKALTALALALVAAVIYILYTSGQIPFVFFVRSPYYLLKFNTLFNMPVLINLSLSPELAGLLARSLAYVMFALACLLAIMFSTNKKTWFTGVGQRTMVVFLFHMIITVPFGEKLAIFDSPILNLAVLILASVLLTAILSLPIVKKWYDAVMDKIASLFIKKAS